MVDAVVQWHRLESERVDSFKAAHVVTVLVWKRAALVMRVDAAVGAEVVLGYLRIELIDLQCFLTLNDLDARERYGSDDCALPATD